MRRLPGLKLPGEDFNSDNAHTHAHTHTHI